MKKLLIILILPLFLMSFTPKDKYFEREIIAKTATDCEFIMALDNGDTYYATFGEYSLVDVGDVVIFHRNWLGYVTFVKVLEIKIYKE
jgi:hypothetical protein